jgi:uncharacterized membrane protein
MPFLGLIMGAVIGGAASGFSGGFLGALLGLFIGWMIGQNRRSTRESRVERLESELNALRERVARLEQGAQSAAPPQSQPAASITEADTQPSPQLAPPPAAEPVAPPAPAAARAEIEPVPAAEPVTASAFDPPEPKVPAPEGSELAWLRRLVSGNIVAKVGVLILFFGVGFLLKYAYDNALLPVPLRLAGVAAVAFGMCFAGWRLLATRRLYGLILQGGGIGLLYLDVFFALKIYGLVGATTGFVAFMALGVAATLLAVRQDARVLAVLGLTGAFLAPILASTGRGDHVLLFSYYTLLNAFILAISWFKAWRDLNLVGFIFTFAVGWLWGANNYRPELFATVEPFVLVFFAMYLVIPILFAQRQPPELRGLVDGTLVFGTPLCVAFMQSALVKDLPYGLAWSAAVAAVIYAVLAFTTIRREGMKLLGETYVALAVVLLTLAIFFAFDAYPTFALWTLEGAAIVWVGLRQGRAPGRWFGYALQLAGTVYFALRYRSYDLSSPVWNEFVIGCGFIAAAGFVIAWLLQRYDDRRGEVEPSSSLFALWAAAWWAIGGTHAIYDGVAWNAVVASLLCFVGASVAVFELAGSRLQWNALRELARLHLPALAAVALVSLTTALGDHGGFELHRPLANGGYWAWPLNVLLLFWMHARHVRDGLAEADSVVPVLTWALVALLATWDAGWLLAHGEYGQTLVWGLAAIVAGCVRFRLRERDAPAVAPVAVPALVWGVVFWFAAGAGWIDRDVEATARAVAALALVAATCFGFELLGAFAQWPALRRCAALLPAGVVVALLAQYGSSVHPFAHYGWFVWPIALALHYLVLRRQEKDQLALLVPVHHVAGLWAALGVVVHEGTWQLERLELGWPWLAAVAALPPAAAMAWITRHRHATSWPFGAHYVPTYREWGLGGVAAWLVLWMLYANVSEPGSMRPLVYMPLLNPLDVASACALAALWFWSRSFDEEHDLNRKGVQILAAFAFVCVNCVLLRTIHYWADVPYEWPALSRSVLVQSGFSLLWTASAFVLMLYATRNARRKLWMVGAALLAVVVLKLFLNDLASTGTIARIVSFLGVGAGLLAIGYVAPVPPGDRELSGK